MATPVTGAQHQIAAGDYRATVTELGAGLRELRWAGLPVLAGYAADELPPGAAGQLLLPWPNRVDAGRYHLDGAEYQLDLSEPGQGNAIHGLTRWAPWSLVRRSGTQAVLAMRLLGRAGYPFCLEIEAAYQLSRHEGLRVRVTARNTGSRPAPYGTGSHPYLSAGRGVDECELTLPCSQWLPVDGRGIPSAPAREVAGGEYDFRAGRRIGRARLDHAFSGLTRDGEGRAWVRLAGPGADVALWAGAGYRWLQVFTGDTLAVNSRRRALAVEPMTCPPNAFVTGTDLIMLEPDATVSHSWGVRAGAGGVTRAGRPAGG